MSEHFNAVAWMRQRRESIDQADEGLTWEEKKRRTLDLLRGDPLWERLKHRVARPPVLSARNAPR